MKDVTILPIKVMPSASQTAIAGWLGDTLKIRVQAPPERGKANAAVLKLMARTLSIPLESITLLQGETSPQKILSIQDLTLDQIQQKIPPHPPQ